MAKPPKRDARSPQEQHRDFVKAAREHGADESDDAFDKVLKRLTKAPPPKSVQKRKRKPRSRR